MTPRTRRTATAQRGVGEEPRWHASGYFSDPDGHAWEIAYNPGFPLADDGTLTIPDPGQE